MVNVSFYIFAGCFWLSLTNVKIVQVKFVCWLFLVLENETASDSASNISEPTEPVEQLGDTPVENSLHNDEL